VCKIIFRTGLRDKQYCSNECAKIGHPRIILCCKCGEPFISMHSRRMVCNLCKIPKKKRKNNLTELDINNVINNVITFDKSFNNKHINYWNLSGFNEPLKDKILERDSYMCYICGKVINLHVHHIVSRNNSGSHIKENLVTLCGGCHRSVENGDVENAIKKCVTRTVGKVSNKLMNYIVDEFNN
jgi:hypothetical protein